MNNNQLNSMQSGLPIQPHVMHGGINQHHMGVINPQGMIPAHMVNIQQQLPQQQIQQQQLQQQQLQQQQIQQQLTPQQQLQQQQQIPTPQQIIPSQQQLIAQQQQQLSNQQQITPQQQLQLQQQQQIPPQQQLLQQQQEQLNSPHKQPSEAVSPDQTDPVFRAKLLLPHLKEAYKKLMTDSASALKENITADSELSAFDGIAGNPGSSIDTFNEILDHMESNLRLALDTLSVNRESSKYAPSHVQVYSKETQATSSTDSMTYPQYLAHSKNQVAFGKELKDIISRTMNKIGEHSSLPQPVEQ